MKNKNIYFVGYFHGIEAKEKFLNLFQSKKKFIFESSHNKYKGQENTKYMPELIYKVMGQSKYLFLGSKPKINSLFRKAYRRDFKYYQGLKINLKKINKLKMNILLVAFTIENFMKLKNGIERLNMLLLVREIVKTVKLYRSQDVSFMQKLKNYLFRKKFLIGYKYYMDTLKNLQYDPNGIYLLWGKSYSSRIILIDYLHQNKIPYLITEFGEVPGTVSCSPNGIFGEIFSKDSWDEFCKNEVELGRVAKIEQTLEEIKNTQVSTREYDSNMYFLLKHFYENTLHKENQKKIIYVNGAELYSSDLFWGRWNIRNKTRNPNKVLLEKVVQYFDKDEYMIIYKEHPMTMSKSDDILLSSSDFPTVQFLQSMNIHDIMDMSDMIISYPSKVVITALMYKKKTFVVGDFTIPYSIPSIKYFTSREFQDIDEMVSSEEKFDSAVYVDTMSKLIEYSLVIYDQELYGNFNLAREEKKLTKSLEHAISVQKSYW